MKMDSIFASVDGAATNWHPGFSSSYCFIDFIVRLFFNFANNSSKSAEILGKKQKTDVIDISVSRQLEK